MGLKPGTYGSRLLREHPQLNGLMVDVPRFLDDWQRERVPGLGTQEPVLNAITQQAGFLTAIQQVLGKGLMNAYVGLPVIVACAHGRHRSVAVATHAKRIADGAQGQKAGIYHMELDTPAEFCAFYWQWLEHI